uniref:Ovule protein n=1 Tax=Anisakis simplex TaxID=6269 RepID=A0A0M3JN85_ANISI
LRTRRCEYDNTNPMSKGCSGKSYEVRECFDGLPCHTTRPPPIPPSHLLWLNKRKGHSDQKSSSSSDNNKLSLKAKRPTSSLKT